MMSAVMGARSVCAHRSRTLSVVTPAETLSAAKHAAPHSTRAGAPGAIKALRVGEKIFRGGAKSSLVIQYTSNADLENWSDCGCCEPPSGEWLELRRMLVE